MEVRETMEKGKPMKVLRRVSMKYGMTWWDVDARTCNMIEFESLSTNQNTVRTADRNGLGGLNGKSTESSDGTYDGEDPA